VLLSSYIKGLRLCLIRCCSAKATRMLHHALSRPTPDPHRTCSAMHLNCGDDPIEAYLWMHTKGLLTPLAPCPTPWGRGVNDGS
jgi:hypothetical protein